MPCNLDLTKDSIKVDSTGSVSIPGYGFQIAPKWPEKSPFDLSFLNGFPENLGELVNLLSLILPSGEMKASSSPNFMKDAVDYIMKLLDYLFPFLMVYKFFLPILELIICIIEVLCAIPNPFKLIRRIRKLFRQCLPNFLSLFPIFAIIIMIISLLLLLLAIIEYIIQEIIKLIEILLENIINLYKAIKKEDEIALLSIITKIAKLLCGIQNLFTIFIIINQIIKVFKDIISLLFNIPPCDDNGSGNADNCCEPSVCPAFIKNNETFQRTEGTLQYLRQITNDGNIIRNESIQFFDTAAAKELAFINITQPYDLPNSEPTILKDGVVYNNKIFFPSDANYDKFTQVDQAPYLVDLRFDYDPSDFGRQNTDTKGKRKVKLLNCIVQFAPNKNKVEWNNQISSVDNGILILTGGKAVEDDGVTSIKIDGFDADIASFIHISGYEGNIPANSDVFYVNGFGGIEYIFKINHEVLLQKTLITLGCVPSVAFDRNFINTAFAGSVATDAAALQGIINGSNFPNIDQTVNCLNSALLALQSNISEQGVAEFQATTNICLNKLKDDTINSVNSLILLGFDPSKSTFTLEPNVQFTTKSILVTVKLNDSNGASLINNLPESIANNMKSKLKAIYDFGTLDDFTYNISGSFTADLKAKESGNGKMKMSFDGKTFITITIPDSLEEDPSSIEKLIDYQFIYSPAISGAVVASNDVSDTDGIPRRDETDVANQGD